jgi:hypothetical protein
MTLNSNHNTQGDIRVKKDIMLDDLIENSSKIFELLAMKNTDPLLDATSMLYITFFLFYKFNVPEEEIANTIRKTKKLVKQTIDVSKNVKPE